MDRYNLSPIPYPPFPNPYPLGLPPVSNHSSRRQFLSTFATATAAFTFAPRLLAADEPKPRKLGLALCGLGSYSNGELAPALLETAHVKLVAAITGTRAKGEKLADSHGFAKIGRASCRERVSSPV